jgi:opacity protein-like surface antigen
MVAINYLIKHMKKIILSALLLSSLYSFSQDEGKNSSKFSVSLHYIGNLDNGSLINHDYNGVIGLDARYSFFQNEKVNVSAGLGIDYLQESSKFFKNDALVFNPNIGVEVNIFNAKLRPFFNLGYSFFTYKIDFDNIFFEPNPSFDPVISSGQSKKYNSNGISLNPGLRYHFSDVLFAEGSYRFVGFSLEEMSGTSKTHFFQVGLGFKF